MRIVIEQPVISVLHSLQDREGNAFDPKRSNGRRAARVRLYDPNCARPEILRRPSDTRGAERRFVYIRIGQLTGDLAAPWTRRMKIDIHDIAQQLLDRATNDGRTVELSVIGTSQDGTPACATVLATRRLAVWRRHTVAPQTG
jgi:hypothetical protein